MSLFTKLNVTNNDITLPRLSTSEVRYASGFEEDAGGHWIFDSGDNSSYESRVSSLALTEQSAVIPTFNSNHIVLNANAGDGLITGLTDTDVFPESTFFIVAKMIGNYAYSAPVPLMGNYDGTGGFMLDANNPVSTNDFGISGRFSEITPSNTELDAGFEGEWFLLAASYSESASQVVVLKNLSQSAVSSFTGSYTNRSRPIVLGNGYYGASNTVDLAVAEFGIFDRALNQSELEALYNRSKERMAVRGITIA